MADSTRYVVVREAPEDRTIIGGPYLWDGHTDWTPPDDGDLMREAEALEAGFRYPASS